MSDKFEFIDVEYAAYQESDEQYVPSIMKCASGWRCRIPVSRLAG